MQTVFIVNGHDYTRKLKEIKPIPRNDIDAKTSGRNLLNGDMYRKRVANKQKWNISFGRLTETLMSQLLQDMDGEFVQVTMLDPQQNRHIQRTYYCTTVNGGIQHSIGDSTVYDGVNFNIIER